MKDILEKASELGRLIKNTEEYVNFEKAAALVEADKDASMLLKKYNELAETIKLKQDSGFQVEQYEIDRFRELTATVSSSLILREYLAARDNYMNMLLNIYDEININGKK